MKILVLGDRGSAHALVWKLFSSTRPGELACAPGNGGTALLVPSAALTALNAAEICHWAISERFSLVIPTKPVFLQAGLADEGLAFHLPVFGAPQRMAQLEQSRLWAKAFLLRNNLPTPPGRPFSNQQTAEKFLAGHQLPVTLRSDLPMEAEGTYRDRYSALDGLGQMFSAPLPPGHQRGAIVEEYVAGPRVALSALSDGEHLLPLLPVRLYEHLRAGEREPPAPAMGAHAGASPINASLARHLHKHLLLPLAAALAREGMRHHGLLGVDCILGQDGPLITNVRSTWSALEAQVLLPRLQDDLLPIIEAIFAHRLAELPPLRWKPQASVALGVVVEGYPDEGDVGIPIGGLSDIDVNTLVFHSQTHNPQGMQYSPVAAAGKDRDLPSRSATSATTSLQRSTAPLGDPLGAVVSTGREVLSIVALGDSLQQARMRVYENAKRITFQGRYLRGDIAEREL